MKNRIKVIAMVLLVGLSVSCGKKKQCDAAQHNTEVKLKGYLDAQQKYYNDPTPYNESKMKLNQQEWTQAESQENNICN